MKVIKIGLGIISILIYATSTYAQKDLVKFGAISRGVVQESVLGEADTTNPNRQNTGETVVDLRVNINPNRKTEIGAVIRMQSDLGGFYGAGSALSLRQLYVKGLLYDVVSYELGDIYLEMSPYTLYNTEGELQKNEAKIFNQLRTDYAEYDNFNIGNTWWSQGGHINGGLKFDSLGSKGAQFDLLSTRIVAANTMRFLTGGRAAFYNKDKYSLRLNAVRVFDAERVTPDAESLQNMVNSLEWNYYLTKDISLFGEAGFSNYKVNAPYNFEGDYLVPEDKNGEFINAGAQYKLLDGRLTSRLKYLQNSANFYSVGAQSKRLDFTASPELFLSVANNPFTNRALNMYDLLANQNMYNSEISGTLMNYNPMYGNVLPYGEATPNRKGLLFNTNYADSASIIKAGLDLALLSDVTGVGTSEKRSFSRINFNASLDVAQLIEFKRDFVIGGALNTESTTRKGDASSIDLKSTSVDVNLEFELFKRLYVLGGLKTISAEGNEFIYDLSDRNQYTLPSDYLVNINQTLTGIGVRYQFSDNMYLSIKNFNIDVDDRDVSDNSYAFNQWMLFFSLKL